MAAVLPSYDDDLRLALVLADEADAITLNRFGAADLHVQAKADATPVTDADRAAEEAIRGMLRRVRPRDAVSGEEFADTGHGPRRWILDPIDGTKNYLRGVPVWASLIALLDGDEVVASVVSAPALSRRWWAARGTGAWTGRSLSAARTLAVSKVEDLSRAYLSFSDLREWQEHGAQERFLRLCAATARQRAFGDFWSYMLVAEGAVDVAAEPEVALHDLAAVALVVTEAGGRFTDLSGAPGPAGGSAVATNGLLHDAVLTHIGSVPGAG